MNQIINSNASKTWPKAKFENALKKQRQWITKFMPSNMVFKSSNVEQLPRETKEYPTKKFESKVMIWSAVSKNDVNRVYVAEQEGMMNEEEQ